MGKGISKPVEAHELEPVSLSELIHQHVRVAIETAVHEELRPALGANPYERRDVPTGLPEWLRERTLRDRSARSRSRCLGLPSSAASATRKNGRRASSRAISGACRRSMKRWSPRTWQAATPAGFAARSSRCSRPRRSRRARYRASWPH